MPSLSHPRSLSPAPLLAQLVACVVTLSALGVAPPASGAILLVPITATARHGLAATAIEHGALLVRQGPVAGSLVVRGTRSALGIAMLRRGIVPLAAQDKSCGENNKVGNSV